MRMSDRFEKVKCKKKKKVTRAQTKKCMQEGTENIGGVEGAIERGD